MSQPGANGSDSCVLSSPQSLPAAEDLLTQMASATYPLKHRGS